MWPDAQFFRDGVFLCCVTVLLDMVLPTTLIVLAVPALGMPSHHLLTRYSCGTADQRVAHLRPFFLGVSLVGAATGDAAAGAAVGAELRVNMLCIARCVPNKSRAETQGG